MVKSVANVVLFGNQRGRPTCWQERYANRETQNLPDGEKREYAGPNVGPELAPGTQKQLTCAERQK